MQCIWQVAAYKHRTVNAGKHHVINAQKAQEGQAFSHLKQGTHSCLYTVSGCPQSNTTPDINHAIRRRDLTSIELTVIKIAYVLSAVNMRCNP
jgi:hypothetical protein